MRPRRSTFKTETTSLHTCVRYHILEVCFQGILQTSCANFTKFTSLVQLRTKMNWSDFEVRRSKQNHVWSKLTSSEKQLYDEGILVETVHCQRPSGLYLTNLTNMECVCQFFSSWSWRLWQLVKWLSVICIRDDDGVMWCRAGGSTLLLLRQTTTLPLLRAPASWRHSRRRPSTVNLNSRRLPDSLFWSVLLSSSICGISRQANVGRKHKLLYTSPNY